MTGGISCSGFAEMICIEKKVLRPQNEEAM